MIRVVKDPENYMLEELIELYIAAGLDEENAKIYAKMAKYPPPNVKIE
ncbi:hypothetical protein EV190_102154 [Actinorugispora endophytica]|uniref:Uncharacterized protein n=2 Tax=Actinorugispora endophytica TaxID=1605990 RepID=A0A4R6V2Q3_9ACTN|nr:hypothetical protein EV190_102154 [Actinorugispora endophytica]